MRIYSFRCDKACKNSTLFNSKLLMQQLLLLRDSESYVPTTPQNLTCQRCSKETTELFAACCGLVAHELEKEPPPSRRWQGLRSKKMSYVGQRAALAPCTRTPRSSTRGSPRLARNKPEAELNHHNGRVTHATNYAVLLKMPSSRHGAERQEHDTAAAVERTPSRNDRAMARG